MPLCTFLHSEESPSTTGGNAARSNHLRTHLKVCLIQTSHNASQNIAVQEAVLRALAQQALEAQGGPLRQHDQPATGWFPTPFAYQQWRPRGQLRRPFLLKNGPQSASAELPERAEHLHGVLAATQAPASERGRGRRFGEPRLEPEPQAQCTPEEKEMQLHAASGRRRWRGGGGEMAPRRK